jgi:hypothetical protein
VVVVAELGDVIVQFAGEGRCFGRVFFNEGARSRHRQEGRLVADVLGKGPDGFGRPW